MIASFFSSLFFSFFSCCKQQYSCPIQLSILSFPRSSSIFARSVTLCTMCTDIVVPYVTVSTLFIPFYVQLYILLCTQHFTVLLFTRVGTLIVATIYLQLIQNRYIFQSFTVLQSSHQHCVQPVASDVEVVGYL